jgi:hypothetical protein
VLWQICAAVLALLSVSAGGWIGYADNKRWLFLGFHAFVWIPSVLTTVIPWAIGIFGFNGLLDDGASYCWFVPGNLGWELGQFYIPLYIALSVSLATFVYLVWTIQTLAVTRSMGSTSDSSRTVRAKSAQLTEQRLIFTRLAFQLFMLSFVLLPDSVSYFVSNSGVELPTGMYQTTAFIWKCESWLVAVIWLSNMRVQEAIMKIPSMRRLRDFLCSIGVCGSCSDDGGGASASVSSSSSSRSVSRRGGGGGGTKLVPLAKAPTRARLFKPAHRESLTASGGRPTDRQNASLLLSMRRQRTSLLPSTGQDGTTPAAAALPRSCSLVMGGAGARRASNRGSFGRPPKTSYSSVDPATVATEATPATLRWQRTVRTARRSSVSVGSASMFASTSASGSIVAAAAAAPPRVIRMASMPVHSAAAATNAAADNAGDNASNAHVAYAGNAVTAWVATAADGTAATNVAAAAASAQSLPPAAVHRPSMRLRRCSLIGREQLSALLRAEVAEGTHAAGNGTTRRVSFVAAGSFASADSADASVRGADTDSVAVSIDHSDAPVDTNELDTAPAIKVAVVEPSAGAAHPLPLLSPQPPPMPPPPSFASSIQNEALRHRLFDMFKRRVAAATTGGHRSGGGNGTAADLPVLMQTFSILSSAAALRTADDREMSATTVTVNASRLHRAAALGIAGNLAAAASSSSPSFSSSTHAGSNSYRPPLHHAATSISISSPVSRSVSSAVSPRPLSSPSDSTLSPMSRPASSVAPSLLATSSLASPLSPLSRPASSFVSPAMSALPASPALAASEAAAHSLAARARAVMARVSSALQPSVSPAAPAVSPLSRISSSTTSAVARVYSAQSLALSLSSVSPPSRISGSGIGR